MRFAQRMEKVKPSATLAITSKAKAMLREGKDVVVLAAGEPDFDTPDVIKQAAIKAINDGFTKYTPAGGTVSLKEAVCRKLSAENGLEYDPGQIVISCGAKHTLYNIFQAICDPGDEVLIIHPYWVSYPEMVTMAGGVSRFIKTSKESGFKASSEDIRSNITKKTKAIVINSPSNPCGMIYEREELEEIARVCVQNNVMMISDEIYEKIIFDGKDHFSVASVSEEARKMTVLVNGVSKSFSMTGWRIGYLAGDSGLAKKVTALQSHSTSNPCSISQVAAETALTAGLEKELSRNRDLFQKRRDFLIKELSGDDKLKPFKPLGAFYMFCDISGCGMDSLTFAGKLLDEKQVAVIPGGPFGDDRFVRISFATDLDTIAEGVKRIKDWVAAGIRL